MVAGVKIGASGDDGGDGVRLSSLLLLKTVAVASSHVGTCVICLVGAGHGPALRSKFQSGLRGSTSQER